MTTDDLAQAIAERVRTLILMAQTPDDAEAVDRLISTALKLAPRNEDGLIALGERVFELERRLADIETREKLRNAQRGSRAAGTKV